MPPDIKSNQTTTVAILSIEDLVYPRQGDRRIVNIEKLVIEGDSVVSILGPNGAGKTSLLRVISQDVQATGKISFKGNSYGSEKWTRSIYHILQEPERNIITDVTLLENIVLANKLNGGEQDQLEAMLLEWSREYFPGLTRKYVLGRYLSGGEKQALGLLLAISREPLIVLLDEHTASLDEKNREICSKVVYEQIRNPSRVVLWVTQDLALAKKYSDSFVIIRNGRCETGPAPKKIKDYTLDQLRKMCFES